MGRVQGDKVIIDPAEYSSPAKYLAVKYAHFLDQALEVASSLQKYAQGPNAGK